MKQLIEGREFFDGEPVELYEIRLGSAFMAEADAAPLSNGDLVTLMVTVRLGDPKFTHVRKSGELKRSNGAKIESLTAFDPEQAKFIYDSLGKMVEGVNYGFEESTSKEQTATTESFEL